MIPLFRNPKTGSEVTYRESKDAFYGFLESVGYSNANIKLHSLRMGGATAYANVEGGGELLASYMGSWQSEARRLYIGTCIGRAEGIGMRIGRVGRMEIAGFPRRDGHTLNGNAIHK